MPTGGQAGKTPRMKRSTNKQMRVGGLQGAHSKTTRKLSASGMKGNTKGATRKMSSNKISRSKPGPTGGGRGSLKLRTFRLNTKGSTKA
jgi:hypothetical protein